MRRNSKNTIVMRRALGSIALVTACGDLVRASGGLGVERRNGAAPDVAAILREAGE